MSNNKDSMTCVVCGQVFDMRDLSQVFFHEHKGLTDDPEMRAALKHVGRGRRVENREEASGAQNAPETSEFPRCPECGPCLRVDEDGCCLSCGRDVMSEEVGGA